MRPRDPSDADYKTNYIAWLIRCHHNLGVAVYENKSIEKQLKVDPANIIKTNSFAGNKVRSFANATTVKEGTRKVSITGNPYTFATTLAQLVKSCVQDNTARKFLMLFLRERLKIVVIDKSEYLPRLLSSHGDKEEYKKKAAGTSRERGELHEVWTS